MSEQEMQGSQGASSPSVPAPAKGAAAGCDESVRKGAETRCATCGGAGYVATVEVMEPGISYPAGEPCPDCDGPPDEPMPIPCTCPEGFHTPGEGCEADE